MHRLLTVAESEAILQKATASANLLKERKYRLQRRVDAHHRIALKSREELAALAVELQVLNAVIVTAGSARREREYNCKIAKAQWRIQLLQLRLEDYSEPALLVKEMQLQQVNAALTEAELFIEQINMRKAVLEELEQVHESTASVKTGLISVGRVKRQPTPAFPRPSGQQAGALNASYPKSRTGRSEKPAGVHHGYA